MKTAIVLLSIFAAALIVVVIMQWKAIVKLTPAVTAPLNPATPPLADSTKSLGDMAKSIQQNGGQFKAEITF